MENFYWENHKNSPGKICKSDPPPLKNFSCKWGAKLTDKNIHKPIFTVSIPFALITLFVCLQSVEEVNTNCYCVKNSSNQDCPIVVLNHPNFT